jgi:arylsulfatase
LFASAPAFSNISTIAALPFVAASDKGVTLYRDQFELFNLREDPFEQNNLIKTHVDEARKLKSNLDSWIKDDAWKINADPIILIGSPEENPTLLNRNDAKGQPGIWAQDSIYGYWDVEVTNTGLYDFNYTFLHNFSGKGKIRLNLKPLEYTREISTSDQKEISLKKVFVQAGNYRLETWYEPANAVYILPFSVEVRRVDND